MKEILETICSIAAFASLLAFIVGIFSPSTVKCKSRGQVALLYLFLFVVFVTISPHPDREIAVSTTSYVETPPQQEQQKTPSEKSESTKSETKSGRGQPLVAGHFIYTVQSFSFKKSVGDTYTGSTADGIYLMVNLTIKNVSDRTRTIDGSSYTVTDQNGNQYEYSTEASTSLELMGRNTFFLRECQPNISTKGVLIFEVPKKDEYYLHLAGDLWGNRSQKILLK